ncbi:MAG: hypothetical protein NTV58_18375 [Deltaproteobacteria bacterium]|nr:hypothetical protein [Deltaproteobacteria bacterium]
MFVDFFYTLRDRGIPVTPTSFLYFDSYDQIFAHHFKGVELHDPTAVELTEIARAMLDEWLKNPGDMAKALGLDEAELQKMTPEELIQYFLDRLKEQTEAHHGGNRWIGTRGTSPVGHSGHHPGGMRVGGRSMNKSAIKVALERRYRDYSQEGPLTEFQMGEALKRLRRMTPTGPKDIVNVDKTIYQTMRNAGEIEIVFDRRLKDRMKIVLLIDNGGWSMEPYVGIVQTLFHYARSQFKDLKIYFFHNTIYSRVWADPQRYHKPELLEEFIRKDPETRLIMVEDASMAPYELMHINGSIYVDQQPTGAGIDRMKFLARTFRHAVWLNPVPQDEWEMTWTIGIVRQVFPMFELTLDGLEKSILHLMAKH